MARQNSVKVPQPFNEAQVTHLWRSAEVIILKKLKNFAEPGSGSTRTEHDDFLVNFAEFIRGRKLFRSADVLDAKWDSPDNTTTTPAPLYKHYFVVATADAKIGSGNINDSTPAATNSDVVTVNSFTSTEGRGSCTIVLNGREGKYQFKENPFRMDDCVFESNDMVFVNITDLNGKLRRVFTGYISSAKTQTILGESLLTNIIIECEDTLKRLTQSRTNVYPSLNLAEAGGNRLSALNPNIADKLPHEIVAGIMGRAYADLYTAAGFKSKLTAIRNGAKSGNEARAKAAQDEDRLVNSYLRLGATGNAEFPFILAEKSNTNQVEAVSVNGDTVKDGVRKVAIPKRVYGFRRIHQIDARNLLDGIFSGTLPTQNSDVDELAFIVDGTEQPAYKLTFSGQVNLFVSEWKSSYELLQNIASNIGYEFYMDPSGVVMFRPMNITLPFDFPTDGRGIDSQALRASLDSNTARVGSEYWLDSKYIQHQEYTESDIGIFTIAYVIGDHTLFDAAGLQLWGGVAVDVAKFLRLGARVAPVVQKLNLTVREACATYAKALLTRLNANASTAVVRYTGDSRLRPGNPVWIPHRNRIYYVTSVEHSFEVGGAYTTTLTLKYGRRPISLAPKAYIESNSDITRTINFYHRFEYVLTRLKALNDIDVIAKESKDSFKTESDYIITNVEHLTFGGYVWEPVYSLTYESLYQSMKNQEDLSYRKVIAESSQLESQIFLTRLQKIQQQQVSRNLNFSTEQLRQKTASDLIYKP